MNKKNRTVDMFMHFSNVDITDSNYEASGIFGGHRLFEIFKGCNMNPEKIETLLENHIYYDFIVPEELSDYLEIVDFNADDIQVYTVEENRVSFDTNAILTFKLKTNKEKAIQAIKAYQSNNGDLREEVDIFWKTVDNKKLLFDTWWEEDRREDIERSN